MSNLLFISGSSPSLAKIRLGENYETFELNLTDWSVEDYKRQWRNAAEFSIETRNTSAIFKSYYSSKNAVKKIGIYSIIPEERTNPRKFIDCDENSLGFYLTESFVFMSENINTLRTSEAFDQIEKTFGHPFPIYYLDVKNLNRFYLYLSENVHGVSNWYVTSDDVRSIIDINT